MKIKKFLSIVLAVFLLVGCISISASAEQGGTATISLLGEKQAIVSEEYEVSINVEESSQDLVGGVYAKIAYDATNFKLSRIEVSPEFAEANSIEKDKATDLINTSVSGQITVALLDVPNDSIIGDWLTFVFTVQDSAGTKKFEIVDAKVSDAVGVELVTNDLSVSVTENIYAHMIDVNGASIRKDGIGNIRFEAEIDSNLDRGEIAEIGFLMIPAVCLKGDLYNGDLKFTDDNKYTTADGRTVTIASDSKEISKIDGNETKIYCYLTNTTSYKLTTSFAARAYIKMTDGTIIYSDNQVYNSSSATYEKNIKGGTSSKSCIETAKAIYNLYKDKAVFTDEFKTIITKNSWSANEYETIVSELAEIEDSFN